MPTPQNDRIVIPRGGYARIKDGVVDAMIASALDFAAERISSLPQRASIAAVALGGGYGRGDGGVLKTVDGVLPYNDLDFFVVTEGLGRKDMRALDAALAEIAGEMARLLHIDVDFAPARDKQSLPPLSDTLMYQEMLAAHVTIWGNDSAFSCMRRLPAQDLPPLECFRLLLNRGAGLLFALRRLQLGQIDQNDLDYAVRNCHKCSLGCGDALLIASHQYVYSLDKRLEMLPKCVSGCEAVMALPSLYAEGTEFKAQPKIVGTIDEWRDKARALARLWKDVLDECLRRLAPGTPCYAGLASILADRRLGNGRPLKNLVLNSLHGTGTLKLAEAMMPPQYQVLVKLAHRLERFPDCGSDDNFDVLWNRFN